MYEVQKIVASRVNKLGKKQYLVKWIGYQNSQNTWEPERNLVNVKDQLEQYWRNNKTKQSSFRTNPSMIPMPEKQLTVNDDNDISPEETRIKVRKGQKVPDFNSSKSTHKKNVRIIGINQLDAEGFVYKVEISSEGDTSDKKLQWVKRGYFIPDYMLELIQFYQSCLLFKKE